MENYLTIYDMERDYFVFKTRIGFAIASDDMEIDPASISDCLQLSPSRMHRKGDTRMGKRSGEANTCPRTVWAIDSEWTTLEEQTVSHHIEYFKSILLPRSGFLKQYKEDDRFDVSFWLRIETDYGGVDLCLTENEMTFLRDFSNEIRVVVLSVSEIE